MERRAATRGIVNLSAGAGDGAAAAPCGIVSLPARQAAANARLVCPAALIAALLTRRPCTPKISDSRNNFNELTFANRH